MSFHPRSFCAPPPCKIVATRLDDVKEDFHRSKRPGSVPEAVECLEDKKRLMTFIHVALSSATYGGRQTGYRRRRKPIRVFRNSVTLQGKTAVCGMGVSQPGPWETPFRSGTKPSEAEKQFSCKLYLFYSCIWDAF